MRKLVATALLLAPLTALGDVVQVTCPGAVYDIDRGTMSATSSDRPDMTGEVNLIGRNLVEVLWTYPESSEWEHEIIALHVLSKMSTGRMTGATPEKYNYVNKEKCLRREVLP
ncbi:MAG: hypothetical protein ACPG1A_04665 [Halioglobus sp.]